MGWGFKKSFKILPGVKINVGKKGISSATVGGKVARVNVGKKGLSASASVPGTGVSYNHKLTGGKESAQVPSCFCPLCGVESEPSAKFCGSCGGQILDRA